MSRFRLADDAQMYEYEDEEIHETIEEAAALCRQLRPFDALSDSYDDFSKEDLIYACIQLAHQKAQYRKALLDASIDFRNKVEDIG